jgi:hypothetical protein
VPGAEVLSVSERREPHSAEGHGGRAPRRLRRGGSHGVWWRAFQVCVLVGLLCAAYALGWHLAFAVGISIALISTAVVACALVDRGLSYLPRCGAYGTMAGAATTAALGVMIVSPGLGILVIATLVATHPFIRIWMASLVGSAPKGISPETLPGSAPDALADDALCQAWRSSLMELQEATTATARANVVMARQSYLDELTRRHPQAMSAWLSSGAAAAGSPLPFLGSQGGEDPPEPDHTETL